jgi:hypothetical protein
MLEHLTEYHMLSLIIGAQQRTSALETVRKRTWPTKNQHVAALYLFCTPHTQKS